MFAQRAPGGLLLYQLSRHVNGNSYLVSMRRILRIPQVTPYATNGTDGYGVREMCHKERKMGTMVERIQPVSPANFFYNMVKIFANTSNTLTPSRLRTPLVPDMKAPVSARGYPQLERGQSISPSRKRPCKSVD